VNLNNVLTAVAANAAATATLEQQDLAAGDHLKAVNDAVTGAASTLMQINPALAPQIQLGYTAFALGETIISSLVALFRHPVFRAGVQASVQTPTQPSTSS
jgi:hypothetical protein